MNTFSAYELKRQKNIEEKKIFLESLGINKTRNEFRIDYNKKLAKNAKLKLKSKFHIKILRRSNRIKNKPVEVSDDTLIASKETPNLRKNEKLTFEESYFNNIKDAPLTILKNLKNNIPDVRKDLIDCYANYKDFITNLKSLTLNENNIIKLVPERIFSMCWSPIPDAATLFAGDKWGKIGLWNTNITNKEEEKNIVFYPHTSPVSHLSFPKENFDLLYSCSYDGTVKVGNLNKLEFNEVYASPIDDRNLCKSFDFLDPAGFTFLVAQQAGTVVLVDQRTSNKTGEQLFQCSKRSLRTIQVHPKNSQLFMTASADGMANIWDMRQAGFSSTNHVTQSNLNVPLWPKNLHPISTMVHNGGIYSAYFNPITGNKVLSVSMDDTVRVWELNVENQCDSSSKQEPTEEYKKNTVALDPSNVQESSFISTSPACTTIIRHNNNVGRGLSTFRAKFHPIHENLFVIGSMDQPRTIEIYSTEGDLVHKFSSKFLNSVTSLNEFHPTRLMLAGANSSGRAFLWTFN